MKTHFIRFKRKGEPVQIWKCTEDEFNKTMAAIAQFAQIIDLREDLGQIFTFKNFDGSGILPRYRAENRLPEPEITPKKREERRISRMRWEDAAAKRGEEWAITAVARRNNPNIAKAEKELEKEKMGADVAQKYAEEGIEGKKVANLSEL